MSQLIYLAKVNQKEADRMSSFTWLKLAHLHIHLPEKGQRSRKHVSFSEDVSWKLLHHFIAFSSRTVNSFRP